MDINKITLEFLMNPEHYDKYIKNFSKDNEEFLKDKEFYKKRIINLTKKLFNDNLENQQIKILFEMYIKNLIIYFKEIDTKDIIQKVYKNLNLSDISNNLIINPGNLDKINSFIYKNHDPITLDNYIKCTKKEKPEILPLKKNINLNDPKLKNKGLKKKEKSICIVNENEKNKK